VQGFLGEFEVTQQPNECGEDAPGLGAIDIVDNRACALNRHRVSDHKTL
jgi:hypothetical protein